MPRLAAEYSDEVRKLNKKEDILLDKKLRAYRRQERMTKTTLDRRRRDVEKLNLSIRMKRKTPDLEEIDRWITNSKAGQYGSDLNERPKRDGQHSLFRKAIESTRKGSVGKAALKLPPLTKRASVKKLEYPRPSVGAEVSNLVSIKSAKLVDKSEKRPVLFKEPLAPLPVCQIKEHNSGSRRKLGTDTNFPVH